MRSAIDEVSVGDQVRAPWYQLQRDGSSEARPRWIAARVIHTCEYSVMVEGVVDGVPWRWCPTEVRRMYLAYSAPTAATLRKYVPGRVREQQHKHERR